MMHLSTMSKKFLLHGIILLVFAVSLYAGLLYNYRLPSATYQRTDAPELSQIEHFCATSISICLYFFADATLLLPIFLLILLFKRKKLFFVVWSFLFMLILFLGALSKKTLFSAIYPGGLVGKKILQFFLFFFDLYLIRVLLETILLWLIVILYIKYQSFHSLKSKGVS